MIYFVNVPDKDEEIVGRMKTGIVVKLIFVFVYL